MEEIVGRLNEAVINGSDRILVRIRHILHEQDPVIIGNTVQESIDRYDGSIGKLWRSNPMSISPLQLKEAILSVERYSEEFLDGVVLLKYFLLNELGLMDHQDFSGEHKLSLAHSIADAAARQHKAYRIDREDGSLYFDEAGRKRYVDVKDLTIQPNGTASPAQRIISQVNSLTELVGALKVATDDKTVEDGEYSFPIANLRSSCEVFYALAQQLHGIEKDYRNFLKYFGINPKESDALTMLRHARISFGQRVSHRKRELEIRYVKASWNNEGLLWLPHFWEFTKETLLAVTGLGFEKVLAALYNWAHDRIHNLRHAYHHISLSQYTEDAERHQHVVRFDSIHKKRILSLAHTYLNRNPYRRAPQGEMFIPEQHVIDQLNYILHSASRRIPGEIRGKIMGHTFRELIRGHPTNLAIVAICMDMGYLNSDELHHAAKIGIEQRLGTDHPLYRRAEEARLFDGIANIILNGPGELSAYNMAMANVKSRIYFPNIF